MDWIEQLAQIVGPENVHTYLQQRGVTPPPLQDPNAVVQQPGGQMAMQTPQMPQNQPQMAQGAAIPPPQGPTYGQLQGATLQALQPVQQRPQSWGDIGKGLVVPLTLGVLSSMGTPRHRGRGAAIATGAMNAFNAWAQMQQLQRLQQAAQQQAQTRQAGVLANLTRAEGAKQYQQQRADLAQEAQAIQWGRLDEQQRHNAATELAATKREDRLAEMDTLSQQLKEAQLGNISLNRRVTEERLRLLHTQNDALDAEPALRQALADAAPNDTARTAILNKRMPIIQAARFAGVGGRAAADKPVDVRNDQGERETLMQSEWISRIQQGEQVPKWDKTEGADIRAMKNARAQIGALLQDIPTLPANRLPLGIDRWAEYGGYLAGHADPVMGKFFNDVKAATATLGGIAQKMANTRAIAIFNNVNQHFPKIQDSPAQLQEKAERLNFTLDVALDSMGLPALVQNPQRLQQAKQQFHLDTIGNDEAFAKAVGEAASTMTPGQAQAAPATPPAVRPTAAPMPVPPRPAVPSRLPRGTAPTVSGGTTIMPKFQVRKANGQTVQVEDYQSLQDMIRSGMIDPKRDYIDQGRDLPDAQPGEEY